MSYAGTDHWLVCVFYSSHSEQGHATSAREAQEQLLPLLAECDPGYAYGMTVEMHADDTFQPAQAPPDRVAYFALTDEGTMKMIDREEVYKLALLSYTLRKDSD